LTERWNGDAADVRVVGVKGGKKKNIRGSYFSGRALRESRGGGSAILLSEGQEEGRKGDEHLANLQATKKQEEKIEIFMEKRDVLTGIDSWK